MTSATFPPSIGTAEMWWDATRQVWVGGNLDFNGSNVAGCVVCGWRGQPRLEDGKRSTYCPACEAVDTHEATGNDDLRVCAPEDVYGRGWWASLGFWRSYLYRPKRRPGEYVGDHGRIMRIAPVVPLPKVGRNDPCTCGSGRKFKKCCGAIAA